MKSISLESVFGTRHSLRAPRTNEGALVGFRLGVAIPLGAVIVLTAGSAVARSTAKTDKSDTGCFDRYESVQELKEAGKLIDAEAAAAACSASECPGEIRESCSSWLREIRASVPSLVVTLRDERGLDVVPRELVIDGAPVAPTDVGKPLERDPGIHAVEVRAESGETFRSEVTLVAGEKSRVVSFKLAPPVVRTETKETSLGWTSPLFIGGASLFLVGAGVATIGTIGRFDLERCKPNCSDAEIDTAHNWLTVADVGFVAAGVGLGGALLFLFLDTEETTKLSGGATPGGFSATLSRSF